VQLIAAAENMLITGIEMESQVLIALTRQLTSILNNWLSKNTDNWWQLAVLDKLTFQQQAYAKNYGINSLEQLDLAAILRIVDQNWFELSQYLNLARDDRNWLKEAQSIRNRWAHAPAAGLDVEMLYRDLDTIERLQKAFGAQTDDLACVQGEKQKTLSKISNNKGDGLELKKTNQSELISLFKLGDVIRLKADSIVTGAIVGQEPGSTENRYQVFHDGSVNTYYESQIELADIPNDKLTVDSKGLHAALSALQLRHPSTHHLYSLFASRIQFIPYQFRPVIKLIQADRPRMLIADEVGVGKTIEAGLILKELQARSDIKSVLVICPKPLVAERKWQEEMKRFDERFEHLDGASLRYCIEETHLDGIWPQKYSRAILPYSLFDEGLLMGKQKGRKKQLGLLDLDPPPAFDLVIVDEAHHIRNTDTWAYRNVRQFCDNAEAVVLLSATPIQLGDNDLYNLLHLIRPDIIQSRQDFDHMAEPNPHLNVAIEAARTASPKWEQTTKEAINRAISTSWGKGVLTANPKMQQACDYLQGATADVEKRLGLIRLLEELYTFSPLINRTRRRDIGSFTTRKPETVAVDFTLEQSELHQNLIDLIARILAFRHGDQNLNFMLTTLRRQIASCVFGLAPLLEAMLERHLSQLQISEMGDEEPVAELSEIFSEFRSDVDGLIRQASLLKGPDPKFEAFVSVIRDKQKLENNKLLVFSGFRHTLAYLVDNLIDEPVRIGLIHGDIPDDERRELRNRFSLSKEDPKALDVLLSSEVGCEGLDYQFCDGLINYDLPWNPMRVEQRIGRIDRYGQKSEVVVIYNFITNGTVDADIYERCLLRIGVFNQALGGSEEILGKLTREIRKIAENQTLTPEEQKSRLQQISDNEIRIIQEQAKLEEEQAKLFGLSMPKYDDQMVKEAASFWLAPSLLANLINYYLERLGAVNIPESFGDKAIITLQLNKDIREKLLIDFKLLKTRGINEQVWSRWLKGNDPYLSITFDPNTASDRRDLVFITPTHPLVRQASLTCDSKVPLQCSLIVNAGDISSGRYPFAIYRWRILGEREDFSFQPVLLNEQLNSRILELLETAQNSTGDIELVSSNEEEQLENKHYQNWVDSRAVHIERVQQESSVRLASLKTSYLARNALLEDQLNEATDERIKRMHGAQVASALSDYERRKGLLEVASKKADIVSECVVHGVLSIENNA